MKNSDVMKLRPGDHVRVKGNAKMLRSPETFLIAKVAEDPRFWNSDRSGRPGLALVVEPVMSIFSDVDRWWTLSTTRANFGFFSSDGQHYVSARDIIGVWDTETEAREMKARAERLKAKRKREQDHRDALVRQMRSRVPSRKLPWWTRDGDAQGTVTLEDLAALIEAAYRAGQESSGQQWEQAVESISEKAK